MKLEVSSTGCSPHVDFDKLNVVVAGNSASDGAKKFVLLPFINTNLAKKAKNLFHSLKSKVSFQEVFILMFGHMNQALR